MVPIYNQEHLDGLDDRLKNSTVAFITNATKTSLEHNLDIGYLKSKAHAAGSLTDTFGLYTFDSILASIGWNANDDVFDGVEMWKARASAVNRPVNFMHNESDIIGHMIASVVLDQDGKLIANDTKSEELPKMFDVVVAAVLYTTWSDKNLQLRMDQLLKEIPEEKWFVSMECIFDDFDYAIITPKGEHKTIARSKDTAFLTKHLRIYGGSGEYDGHRLGRKLKNFVFVGKGIVDNPANKRSKILLNTDIKFDSTANLTQFPKVEASEMSDTNLVQLETKFDTGLASISATLKDLGTKAVAEVTEKFEKQLAEVNAKLADKDKTIAAHAEVVKSFETKVTEAEAKVAKKDEELKAVATELLTVKREAKAVAAGLTAEEAIALVKTWASVSDEQFESVLKLNTKKTTEKTSAAQLLDGVDKPKEAALVVPPENANDQTRAKAASWFEQNMFAKKGNK